jgi:predicted phosphohydrolase
MFTSISWQSYLVGVGSFLILYYVVVGLKFYKKELKGLFKPKSTQVVKTQVIEDGQLKIEDDFQDVEHLITRVKEVFELAGKEALNKSEVEDFLALVFTDYPTIKDEGLRASVNEFVVSEARKIEQIELNFDEVGQLWDR